MKILFATSEAVPFAQTGGLADVSHSLPVSLAAQGQDVAVIMPAYQQIESGKYPLEPTNITLEIPVGTKIKKGTVLKGSFPDAKVPVYFVKHDDYYHREGLYNNKGNDYSDNCERFIFFCRSVLETIRLLNLDIDIIHANDWQTGLIPAYLELLYKKHSRFNVQKNAESPYMFDDAIIEGESSSSDLSFDSIHSVFTIHNMRHQGRFSHWDMLQTGLDWKYFTFDMMEFYGQLNLLKTGMIFADKITTVSPRYAEEIQTEAFGEKLHGVLQYRRQDLTGILNGIDINEWNPATDPNLVAPYDINTVFENKPKCKAALQKEMGLPLNNDVPLFGIVSRFDSQKGLDLVIDVAEFWIQRHGIQLAVLGTGERKLEERFLKLAQQFPQNVSVQIRYQNALSHRIEAGADIFLMPSRYEPCGLNQMYSQRYGTLPLVRETGGLANTIINASNETMANQTANGFSFFWGTADEMNKAIDWAIKCYFERKPEWKQMIQTAMKQDHSWNRSALHYMNLYQELLNK
ncbi:MAG: glycogen synthase [Planctomycetia bacterium]|nr:glycogen synthase [Planctomycetia bacterium]